MSLEKVLINYVGISGSGKSTVCKAAAVALGAARYTPSNEIRTFAASNSIALTEPSDYRTCLDLMTKQDPDALIRPILQSPASVICVDSLRRVADIKRLRDCGIPVVTLFLWASPYNSYDRVRHDPARSGGQRALPPTFEEFEREADIEWCYPDPWQPAVRATIFAGEAYEVIDVDPLSLDDPPPTKEQIIDLGIQASWRLLAQARIDSMQQR